MSYVDHDYICKILIIGSASVGKSSILLKYVDNLFDENSLNTIGVDFKIKTIKIGDKMVKLQIWDTAGCERFKSITASYYRGCNVIIFAYDITSESSFENIPRLVNEVKEYCANQELPLFYLVGCKSDLESKRRVKHGEGLKMATFIDAKFFECSAKSSICIHDVFDQLAIDVVNSGKIKSSQSKILIPQHESVKVLQCCS